MRCLVLGRAPGELVNVAPVVVGHLDTDVEGVAARLVEVSAASRQGAWTEAQSQ